jgi:glycosyltransferase involved in cell wall biosynthesis
MKLAIVSTHPIQYNAPWFRHLSRELEIKVFYLWDFGVTEQLDRGFGRVIKWDVPLLSGYDYEFVRNTSRNPGTHRFRGLQNPALKKQVSAYNPSAVLLMTYNYESIYRFLWRWDRIRIPLLFRGDSHRIVLGGGLKEHARRRFIAQVFKRFGAFLYVGKANHDYYEYHGVPSQKLFFAPHAVDNDYFVSARAEAEREALKWRSELGIPGDYAVVMFAGKFEEKKRPLDLVEAFCTAQLDRTVLLLVGSGKLEGELRARAEGHPGVRFAPFQNQSLMPRTYAAADMLVLPSYGPGETWGLVVNEAMCLGRPVIVSDHVGCAQDLIFPRSNGLVFPAGDVNALADCLTEALSDRVRLHGWGEESRSIISRCTYRQATEGLKAALLHVCAAAR